MLLHRPRPFCVRAAHPTLLHFQSLLGYGGFLVQTMPPSRSYWRMGAREAVSTPVGAETSSRIIRASTVYIILTCKRISPFERGVLLEWFVSPVHPPPFFLQAALPHHHHPDQRNISPLSNSRFNNPPLGCDRRRGISGTSGGRGCPPDILKMGLKTLENAECPHREVHGFCFFSRIFERHVAEF